MSEVIVFGVESPTGLAIVRDLGKNGSYVIGVAYTSSSIGFQSKYCKEKLIRPKNDAEAVVFFRELHRRFGCRLPVIAIGESDIIALNRIRSLIDSYCILTFPKQQQMDKVLDKEYLQNVASSVGIPIPETYSVFNASDVASISDKLIYPVVLKWSNPHDVIDLLKNEGITLEKVEYCIDQESFISCMNKYDRIGRYPMIQRYYPGKGIGYFFLCNKGEALLSYAHQRIHEWPPEGGASCLCKSNSVSELDPAFIASRKLLAELLWQGIAMVEFRYDEKKNEFVLMEINGRFWGSSPLFVASRIYMATALVRMYLGQNVQTQPQVKSVYSRFMIPEVKRIIRIVLFPNKIKDPIVKFSKIREFLFFLIFFFNFRVSYYFFDSREPKPFVIDIKNEVKKLFKF